LQRARARRGAIASLFVIAHSIGLGPGCSRHPYVVRLDTAPWIRALGSDDLFESDPAVDKLVSLGADVIPPLRLALEQEPPSVRVGVVEVLWRMHLPEADRLLIRAATDDADDEVRYEAVHTLVDVQDPARIAAVELALDDRSARVRFAAAQACARLCESTHAIERLIQIALTDSATSAAWARASAREILKDVESARATQARTAIERQARPRLHAAPSLDERVRAALLLADIMDDGGTATLVAGAKGATDERLRQHALFALGSVGTPDAVPEVSALLHDPNAAIVAYSHDALRRMAARETKGAAEALQGFAGPVRQEPVLRPHP
jgi:HEAT repeat protein